MTYCEYVKDLPLDNPHRIYHDTEYGFPLKTDDELFCRLILEINQAGLSWNTILNKKQNFYKAYDKFNVKKVSKYSEKEINRLLNDPGIIRNKLKINAAIYNANVIINFQRDYGSFKKWLDKQGNLELNVWTKLFKQHFKFVGGEIVNEFLVSTAYLPGAHDIHCAVYKKINQRN